MNTLMHEFGVQDQIRKAGWPRAHEDPCAMHASFLPNKPNYVFKFI